VNSIDILLTLVFSIVMLLFMSFPALKISEFLQEKLKIDDKWHSFLVIFFTIVLSLAIGVFLRFA
jgi:hypothetical protein